MILVDVIKVHVTVQLLNDNNNHRNNTPGKNLAFALDFVCVA